MQAAGITAEPVLVGVNGFGPIDGKEPLPLLSYFNHIVVRYRMGQRWIVIDPGRAVADASRTPHFLNHMWALNLKEDKPTLYRIATEDKGYAELKLSSEVIERPTGGYFVRTRMDASGEAANEFKEHYFAEGPEGFRDMVEGLAPDDTLGFRITQQTEITRKSGPLHVEFEYGLADRKGKSKIYYPVHNLTRFGWNHQGARLHFARFSEDLEESVHFRGRFIADEIRYDNVVYGPMVSIERHVRNGGDGAWIEDKIHIPGWVDEGDEKATEQKRGQESIFAWQESHSHIRLGVLAGQRPFEASIDTAIPYSLKEDSERDREGWLSEYRRLQVYLKKVPKDPTLLKASALVVRELGRIGPRSFLNGHLRESNHLLEQAKALQPNSASLWAEIGKNLIWLDDESGARKAFFEGFRLSKADPDVLFLGGLINEKQQKYDAALPYYSAAIQSASSHAQKLEAYENQANVLCWRLTRCPQAAALYDHVLTMAPVKADSFHFAAAIYKQMGDAKKAMELEEKAKSLGGKEDVKFLAETEIQDYDQRYFVDSAYPEKLNQLSEEAANLYRKYPGNLKVLGYLIDLSVKMAKRDNDAIPLGIAHQYAEEARSRGLSADRFSEFEKKIEGAQHELAPARLPASRGTD
jgi:tetratricopeptide (TPR) repeat protein